MCFENYLRFTAEKNLLRKCSLFHVCVKSDGSDRSYFDERSTFFILYKS